MALLESAGVKSVCKKLAKLTPGPALNMGRINLCCGILKWINPESKQMEKIVVAAGGSRYEESFSAVELLYLNENDFNSDEWVIGPDLPEGIVDATMVEYNNSVIIIGGSNDVGWRKRNDLYQLFSPKGPWIKMRQTLKEKRSSHVSFLVPDELVSCNKTKYNENN